MALDMFPVDEFEIEDSSACELCATPEGIEAFVNDGFGLSIHWGLYSLQGRGEWAYAREHIPWELYLRRMAQFDPARFDADEWADLMLESGQRFLLITAKHHDGFCLWDTDLTDFKSTNSAFKRDPLAELARAVHERGLRLHFYYSLLDWTHPAYRDDWQTYVAYYQGQLRELCTRFGEIRGVLFDGYWPRFGFRGETAEMFQPRGAFDLAGTYDLIHSLQPGAVITNNGHVLPQPGEDYQVWELDMPGENTTGFNTTDVGDKPKAVWWNLNSGWSYNPGAHAVKPTDEIMETYRTVREQKAVFMLNVGPRPYGDIHPEEQQVLREIGQRLRRKS